MIKFPFSTRSLFLLALLLATSISSAALPAPQDGNQPNVSEAENKAAALVDAAIDVPAKLAAATKFLGKYPKSSLRPNVAGHIAGHISPIKDPAEKVRLAEELQKLFPGNDTPVVTSVLIGAYVDANRLDDAFALGAKALAANPEDIAILTELAFASSNAAKKQNGKFIATGNQYGAKAIELIEANKKPAGMDDAQWTAQAALRPRLYQEIGILALISRDFAGAKARFEKASSLAPDDPMNYAMMASTFDEEYMLAVKAFQDAPAGAQKDELLKKANAQLDKVIEAYAHAIGVASGRAEYQPLADQARQNMELYYKYRHNNSTDGMQQLIDKYKPQKP